MSPVPKSWRVLIAELLAMSPKLLPGSAIAELRVSSFVKPGSFVCLADANMTPAIFFASEAERAVFTDLLRAELGDNGTVTHG